jgi:hypothetical protein
VVFCINVMKKLHGRGGRTSMYSHRLIGIALMILICERTAHAQREDENEAASTEQSSEETIQGEIIPGTQSVANRQDSRQSNSQRLWSDEEREARTRIRASGLTAKEEAELRMYTFGLAVAVLVFGLFVVCLEIWVMMARKKYWDDFSFKLISVTIIVVSGLFVIVAGYSDEQLAPMMGLLGTTLGYILGRGKQE